MDIITALYERIDLEPNNHFLRAVLADALEESGDEELKILAPGYRKMCKLKRRAYKYPDDNTDDNFNNLQSIVGKCIIGKYDERIFKHPDYRMCLLSPRWFARVEGIKEYGTSSIDGYWKGWYDTRREAEDAAALGFYNWKCKG